MEDFLCSLRLPGRTTISEIFRSLNNNVQEQGLDWGKYVEVCTNSVANMMICHSGELRKLETWQTKIC